MRMSGLLRHGNIPGWTRAPHAIQELGDYGEIRITTAALLLGLDTETVERIAQTSIHPSGDYRYELMEWDGEVFVRAVRGHSHGVLSADDFAGTGFDGAEAEPDEAEDL